MADILLVAEKIHNTTDFIKLLREGTDLSISEIRECILTKKPFFDSSDYYDEDGEVDELIQEILRISKSRGDVIKIFKKYDDDSTREITEELYLNRLKSNKESSKYLDELDEEMYGTDEDEE